MFDHRYGTPKEPIKEALRAGRDILFDIDWQGTQQLEAAMGDDLVPIFILPPSMEELERRLTSGDGLQASHRRPHVPSGRARSATGRNMNMSWSTTDTDRCLEQVRAIVAAERLQRQRQIGLLTFVRDLIGPSH